MKTLMILRHAKASRDLPVADFDRPLKGRGQRDADRLGRILAERNFLPGYILCSSATRAKQTAEGLVAAIGSGIEIEYLRELYLAPCSEYCRAVREAPDQHDRVAAVGHNPAIEEWVAALTGRMERMPPGAMAVVGLAIDSWNDFKPAVRGDLLEVHRPADD